MTDDPVTQRAADAMADLVALDAELSGIDPHAGEDGPNPCWQCRCCALWKEALDLLHGSIKRHVEGELRLRPCNPECLVCGSVEWQG